MFEPPKSEDMRVIVDATNRIYGYNFDRESDKSKPEPPSRTLFQCGQLLVEPPSYSLQIERLDRKELAHVSSLLAQLPFDKLGFIWPARYLVPVRELVFMLCTAYNRTSISVPSLELVFGWFRLQSVRG
jgi:hypothetical protein